jgi:hypothetical protein
MFKIGQELNVKDNGQTSYFGDGIVRQILKWEDGELHICIRFQKGSIWYNVKDLENLVNA